MCQGRLKDLVLCSNFYVTPVTFPALRAGCVFSLYVLIGSFDRRRLSVGYRLSIIAIGSDWPI